MPAAQRMFSRLCGPTSVLFTGMSPASVFSVALMPLEVSSTLAAEISPLPMRENFHAMRFWLRSSL